jgi:hypothetical protein
MGVGGGLGGDVAAGVASADDEHALAFEDVRRFVLAGVQHLAAEVAGVVGILRIPVVAVADDDAAVAPGLRGAVTRGDGDVPEPGVVADGGDAGDLSVESDAALKVEVASVGFKVAQQSSSTPARGWDRGDSRRAWGSRGIR